MREAHLFLPFYFLLQMFDEMSVISVLNPFFIQILFNF